MTSAPHIMLFTGEYSGNIYGATLASALKEICPDVRLSGTGCREMADAGVEILYDSSSWGGIGFIEAMRVLPKLFIIYLKLKKFILKEKPSVLVLIDYPGFNMFFARLAKKHSIPTLYYFPPGKYQTDPSNVKGVADIVTSVAAPFRFTYDVYKKAGGNVEYVGHPMADVLPLSLNRKEACSELGVSPEDTIIGLLPGSRRREIRSHTPMLLKCARKLAKTHTNARFIMPMPDLPGSRIEELTRYMEECARQENAEHGTRIDVKTGFCHETMAAANLLIVSSGTATLEAAWFNTPMVIIYKASWLTELLARHIFFDKLPEFFGLPNIITRRQIVPECIQWNFKEEKILDFSNKLLCDGEYRSIQKDELTTLRNDLSTSGTSAIVAEMTMKLVK